MEEASSGIPAQPNKQKKKTAGLPKFLNQREANSLAGCELGAFPRRVVGSGLRNLALSAGSSFSTPSPGAITALEVDTTECRYLLAGAGNGVLFAYDLEGKGLAGTRSENDELTDSPDSVLPSSSFSPIFQTGVQPAAAAPPSAASVDSPHSTSSALKASAPAEASGGPHRHRISALEWYPVDTGIFISGSFDSTVRVWDTNLVQAELVFDMASRVYSLSMSRAVHSPVHSLVAIGSHCPDVRLCDLNSAICTHTITGHQDVVVSVRWLPCSDWELLSCSRDGAVKQWDIRRSFPCLRTLDQKDTQPGLRSPLAVSRDRRASRLQAPNPARGAPSFEQPPADSLGKRPCFVGSVVRRDAKGMKSWAPFEGGSSALGTLGGGGQAQLRRAHSSAATRIQPILNGLFAFSAGSEPRLRLWDLDSGCDTMLHYNLPMAAAVSLPTPAVLAESPLAVSRDSSLLFVPWGLSVRVFDTFSATCRAVLKGHFDRIFACSLRESIPQLFTGGADGQIVCWEDARFARDNSTSETGDGQSREGIYRGRGIGHVIEPLPDEDFWSD